ncbi:MAG TPA: trypsin-like peptidase domain-containing protein, partial [Planctomycetota bacterium]|nr:trypsin-like peptidase domain-containing protein [Planctomycetota bacterium]
MSAGRFVSFAVLLGAVVFLCFFTGPSVTSKVDAQPVQIVDVSKQVEDARSELRKIEPPTRAFVLISKIVRPSVVTVLTKSRTRMELPRFFNDDEWPFPGPNPFRNRGPDNGRREFEREVQGMGSGFFVDANGDILTNNHVVDGAYEIKVMLADRSSYDATVVGRDPKSDLAVIRVKDCPPAKVVPARLGDSDQLEPGDWVLAIGA